MNINFFEGESRRFGIVFNQDYDVSRLSEVKLEIRARNTEIFLSFSESDGLTVDETGHVYIASIEPADTLYKVGEYKMQISFVDSEIGLRKSKIYDMSIMKSVVSAVTEATVSSDLIDFLVEINVNESVSFSENWDINIIATALSDTIEAAGIAEAQAAIATTKASEAAASASTATTKASEAAASASTATTKATEAAASASNLDNVTKSTFLYNIVTETANGESLNGASISTSNQTITIPTGIAGGSTYLQKRMVLANYPVWAVGHKIMFIVIINENIVNASDNILG
ncbi:hypothetical protein, partial [Emticicia sp. W12TSBA100-4]|uniref:hypothetical protein n=1 Tax=Emticicia sp. W12TSBA100-4 TaxID=3160965 RepID=UPI003305C452